MGERKDDESALERYAALLDYSVDLQRIIEDLCCGREIRTPLTTARFHYDMAVKHRASAPDLLEALEELSDLVDAICEGDYKPDSFTTQPARAAIARAQGKKE